MSAHETANEEEFDVAGFSIVLFVNDNRPAVRGELTAVLEEGFGCSLQAIETDPLPLGDRQAVLTALESVESILDEGHGALFESAGVLKVVTPEAGIIVVEQVPVPYFVDSRAATAPIDDAHLAKAIEEHQGFIEVGILGLDVVDDPADATRRVCRLAAGLCQSDAVVALAVPDRELIAVNRPEIVDRLYGRDPFQWPMAQSVDARRMDLEDPDFDRATADARAHWSEFEAAFAASREGDAFSVKLGVFEGDVCENLWFWVRAIEGEFLECELESEPIYLRGILRGDRRRIRAGEILDWVHTTGDGETFGGFTLSAG